MTTRDEILENACRIIRRFEGCRLEAYRDGGGVWTIGYGHTAGVKEGMRIDFKTAEALLLATAGDVLDRIARLVRVNLKVTQWSALVSFSYNVGVGAFAASTMLKRINDGSPTMTVANEFRRWRFDNGVEVAGLLSRRTTEAAIYRDV